MTTKKKIVWIPSLYSDKLVHLSYNNNGNYRIRDFVHPAKKGKTSEIIPLIKWEMEAKGHLSVPVNDDIFWVEILSNLSEKYFSGKMIDVNNLHSINSSSKLIAEKHTSISCRIEDIFKDMHPEYQTYITVYPPSKYYKDAEKNTKRTFYHLKMYNENDYNVKNPDIIVVDVEKNVIKYVIEVKWGFVEHYNNQTDLKSIFNENERTEIINMTNNAEYCKVNGPYRQNGVDVKGSESFIVKTDNNTMFVIVSDLKGLYDSNSLDFENFKQQYELQYNNIRINMCDIKENVDIFQSFEEYIKDIQGT